MQYFVINIFLIIEIAYYRCKSILHCLVSNCYLDVYLEAANQAIKCRETHAL